MTLVPPSADNNHPLETTQPEGPDLEKEAMAVVEDESPCPVPKFRKVQSVKRIMVVGPTGAGKSSLLRALGLSDEPVSKTEHVRISPGSIDTPGEMLDIPHLYHALIISAVKADLILFVADPTRKCAFPARMAKALRTPVVGVVTKADLASPEEKTRAHKALVRAGVDRAVETSIVDGSGFEELVKLIS